MRSGARAALVASLVCGCIDDAVIGVSSDAAVDAPSSVRLSLRGTISGQGRANATAPDGFVTVFSMALGLDGLPLDGASVHVRTPYAEVELSSAGAGVYTGQLGVWSSGLTLRVQRGGATMFERQVTTLVAHRYPAWINEMPIVRTDPLVVHWAPQGAPEAWLSSPGTLQLLPDNGTVTIAPEVLMAESDNKDLLVRVMRAQTLGLTELAPGSSLRIEVSNEIELHAMVR